ncbi:mpv17-like protein isoform X2 [Phycodurus eques]|uniref:mpv17-like protein isoform X2 n=1 Tax=Phycodurus eques TaxID=693459 RepID=UPI002ACDE896|nr:mpv17-like protein isoform X2 [Phycodurus eques]
MSRAWAAFRAHPYSSNVVGYTALFASADLFQQRVLGGRDASQASAAVDWRQTARVATVGFCFHANFNYQWLRWLERVLPGGGVRAVTGKVVVDQLVATPLTITAFYIERPLPWMQSHDPVSPIQRNYSWHLTPFAQSNEVRQSHDTKFHQRFSVINYFNET